MQQILNYINGEWIEPNVKEYFDVINPAIGEQIAKTPVEPMAIKRACSHPGVLLAKGMEQEILVQK